MTPQERRAKYPLAPVMPMTDQEVIALKATAQEWIAAPSHTSRELDLYYHMVARLIATLEREWDR